MNIRLAVGVKKQRFSTINVNIVQGKSYCSSTVNYRSIEDDGYTHYLPGVTVRSKKSIFSKFFKKYIYDTPPGTLILVRHGESEFNQHKKFTGWVDADLSDRGKREIEHAARLLLERGYTVDVAYTSMLKRAIRSTWILLQELNQIYRPAIKSWRLNERMYGALEGVSKLELANELGIFVYVHIYVYTYILPLR
jgi:hypothetical protein